jgi:outer membrane biosynthesis protein TonB
VFWAIIGESGNLLTFKVEKPKRLRLDRESREALKALRFEPAEKGRQPVRVQALITVNCETLQIEPRESQPK